MRAVSVLVAGSQRLVAESLLSALATQEGLSPAGPSAISAPEAIEMAGRLGPDVAVLDDDLSEGLDAIETTALFRREAPDTDVLILSANPGPGYAQAALDAGAVAVVPKSVSLAQLVEVIWSVEVGTLPVLADVARHLPQRSEATRGRAEQVNAFFARLSSRESDVVRLLCAGLSVKEVARELFVGHGTIRNHLHRILRKAGVGSQSELLRVLRDDPADQGTEPEMAVWQPAEPSGDGVRVFVAHRHRLFAESIGQALLGFPTIFVAGAYPAIGIDAMHTAIRGAPCVLLYGSAMRSPRWRAATRYLDRWAPDVRVLLLSSEAEPGCETGDVTQRSRGVVQTSLSLGELADVIGMVGTGPPTAPLRGSAADEQWTRVEALTPRELEVLQWIALERSAPEIAGRLDIAVGTVRNHLTAILRKTGTRSRREAVALVRKLGLA